MPTQPPPIKYTFDADAKKFAKGAAKVERDLKDIDRQAKDTDKSLDFDVTVDDSALATLRRRLLDARSALEHDIRADVDVDPSEALRNLRRIESQLRSLDRMDVHPEVDVDVDRGLAGTLSGISRSMRDMGPAASNLADSLPVVGSGLAAIGPAGLAAAAGIVAVGGALGPGLVGAGAATSVLVAAKDLLEGYDEIDKGNRKAKIVFGTSLKTVQKWARGLSTNVGLGGKQIVAASSAIQDLLVPQGFKRSDAAAITQEIYERGAALAEFSGLDTEEGVEAVTSALLGARKQLKGLGVDITASEVKQKVALLKGQASFKGYTDKMLNTAATLDLLKEKSGDAWTAFQEGGSEADSVLDTLNATLANLKTDAVEGFGGILVDIIADMRELGGFDLGGFNDLGGWIKDNKDAIRRFFLDVAIFAGRAADAALDLGIALGKMVIDTAPVVAGQIVVWGKIAANIQKAAGYVMMLSPGTRRAGQAMVDAAAGTEKMATAAAESYVSMVAAFGPDVLRGMITAQKGVQGVTHDLETLAAIDEVKVRVAPLLAKDDFKAASKELKTLSAPQLVALVASLDPKSKDETERELRRLAKDRLATVTAIAKTKAAAAALAKLAGESTHQVNVVFKNPYTGKVGKLPFNPYEDTAATSAAPQYSRAAASRSIAPMAAGDTSSTLTVTGAAPSQVTYSPTIVNNYPKPERASDSIASSLRVARYLAGV